MYGKHRYAHTTIAVLALTALTGSACSRSDSASSFTRAASLRGPAADGSSSGVNLPKPGSTPSPSPSPTGGGTGGSGTVLNSTPMGVQDPNCMANPDCDACIFEKGPISQEGPMSPGSQTFGSNLARYQTYCVKIAELTSTDGTLKSKNYAVVPSASVNPSVPVIKVKPTAASKYRFPWGTNCSGETCTADPNRYVGQLMAYYWLNRQNTFLREKAGKAWTDGKAIPVDSNAYDAAYGGQFNSYWDGANIKMLYYQGTDAGDYGCRSGSKACPFSNDAGVYAHEAGHAHFSYASIGPNGINTASSVEIGGYNEGQADFMAFILFDQHRAKLGARATWLGENVTGNNSIMVNRDVDYFANQTLRFDQVQREVHEYGRVVSNIWWSAYKNRRGVANHNADLVIKAFVNHLADVQGDMTLAEVGQVMIDHLNRVAPGVYESAVRAEWASRGITIP